jgi:hypothetical protein
LFVGIQGITIGWNFIIAVKDGNAVFFHRCSKSFPVVCKNLGIGIFAVHVSVYKSFYGVNPTKLNQKICIASQPTTAVGHLPMTHIMPSSAKL